MHPLNYVFKYRKLCKLLLNMLLLACIILQVSLYKEPMMLTSGLLTLFWGANN